MENNNDKRIYGIRCKQARDAKALTQQELADLISTSPQNISKYEREGISDIFVIKELSKALDTDLLQEKIDAEGTVGEVGKEILFILVKNNGYIDMLMLAKNHMHGMSLHRVTLEVKKLVDIGMCVRETYIDWIDQKRDGLFITAKGLITLKNLELNKKYSKKIKKHLNKVKTYEYLLGDFCSFQDYINSRPGEKLIRKLGYKGFEPLATSKLGISNCYRANYIEYLHRNYETGLETHGKNICSLNPGVNCCHDILYRMALGITDTVLWEHWLQGDEQHDYDVEYKTLSKELFDEDEIRDEILKCFKEEFYWVDSEDIIKCETSRDQLIKTVRADLKMHKLKSAEIIEKLKECAKSVDNDGMVEVEDELLEELENLEEEQDRIETKLSKTERYVELDEWFLEEWMYYTALDEIYESIRPEGASKYPIDWFTKEEIEQFIQLNMGPAVTGQEKEIDCILRKINHYIPETLEYYRFPKEWEENGLADLVRRNCGLIK